MTELSTLSESGHGKTPNATDTEASASLHENSADEESAGEYTPRESLDLDNICLPEYTQLVANEERTIDAEQIRSTKSRVEDRSPEHENHPTQRLLSPAHEDNQGQPPPSPAYEEHQTPRADSPIHEDHHSQRYLQPPSDSHNQSGAVPQGRFSDDHTPIGEGTPLVRPISASHVRHYHLSDPVVAAENHTRVRSCSVLHDRPAAWLAKRKNIPLSSLAAAVLTKEGLLETKELRLITKDTDMKRDPTDPISGALLGCYDVVGGIMLGLAAGPIELGKQASPLFHTSHSTKESSSQTTEEEPKSTSTPSASSSSDSKRIPHAAGKVALGTAKGLGRVVTTSLKSPALIMHGVTRGFHNLPKTYGEEVRVYEDVTGLRSGLLVSAKSFGHGLGDGIRDFATKPIDGAEKNGIIGFSTGLMTGIANLAFKPTAGACGLIGYSSVGVYKAIRKIGAPKTEDPAEIMRKVGEAEYQQVSDADKLFIVRLWCQIHMRIRID
ncbi:hypothetical protein COCMIDRAFT_103807 [Bipolaris oryzae ATCC 44560]|uniref:Uncharacterized protein n=1 Tax=Bipolaris oryzae ATCC 44560 TaxID=930090 RepID=W6YXP2_COCMI|nr:uncharacterized protein COCMIDRAFT_103807 [Bipolaris oryzae ATCC 44560]EUC42325.1 hypothetical protein COCMIDRAFT_103807 [Bipolaris oryzae ATCC 44560]